jgi:hypothetical protein
MAMRNVAYHMEPTRLHMQGSDDHGWSRRYAGLLEERTDSRNRRYRYASYLIH